MYVIEMEDIVVVVMMEIECLDRELVDVRLMCECMEEVLMSEGDYLR